MNRNRNDYSRALYEGNPFKVLEGEFYVSLKAAASRRRKQAAAAARRKARAQACAAMAKEHA